MPSNFYGSPLQENNECCLKQPQNRLKLPSAITTASRQIVCISVHPYCCMHLPRCSFEAVNRLSGHIAIPTLSNDLGFQMKMLINLLFKVFSMPNLKTAFCMPVKATWFNFLCSYFSSDFDPIINCHVR